MQLESVIAGWISPHQLLPARSPDSRDTGRGKEFELVDGVVESLTGELSWSQEGRSAALLVDEKPRVRLELAPDRVTAHLVLPGGKAVDVSRQPGAIEIDLRSLARRRHAQPEGWISAAARRVRRWLRECDLEVPEGPEPSLARVLLHGSFPILRKAAASGLGVPGELPAWAAPLMAHSTPRSCLAAALGRRPSRALVRAFARSLHAGGGSFSLAPLSLLIAADGIGDDRLARVVATDCGQPPTRPCRDREELDLLAALFSRMRRRDAEALAIDVLGFEHGIARLVRAATLLRDASNFDEAPPRSLDALETLTLALAPIAPARQERPQRPPRQQHQAPPRRLPAQPLAPRRHDAGDRPPATLFSYDARFARMHLHTFGQLRFVLPRRAEDLVAWATVLDNCLDQYVNAVSTGRSVVVGVQQRDVLVAALELELHGQRIRQFVAARNRPPNARLDELVQRELRRLGLTTTAELVGPF